MQKSLFEIQDLNEATQPPLQQCSVSRSTFYQGNCLVEMDKIADKSVDMILCDLPYGTIDCKWDTIIPLDDLWKCYNRIIKDNGSIVLTSQQPFTSILICSNIKYFRHRWIWSKDKAANFMVVSGAPLKYTEDINVFSKIGHYKPANSKIQNSTYNPQTEVEIRTPRNPKKQPLKNIGFSLSEIRKKQTEYLHQSNPERDGKIRFPSEHLYFPVPFGKERIHPTQKPVELMEYLIKTYTNEGETVLDNCMGSGTTGVACKKTGRHFIGIEKDAKYFELAVRRVSEYCG
jgi:site-specific DNA-methyltransferase (adenine-specific)